MRSEHRRRLNAGFACRGDSRHADTITVLHANCRWAFSGVYPFFDGKMRLHPMFTGGDLILGRSVFCWCHVFGALARGWCGAHAVEAGQRHSIRRHTAKAESKSNPPTLSLRRGKQERRKRDEEDIGGSHQGDAGEELGDARTLRLQVIFCCTLLRWMAVCAIIHASFLGE